MSSMCGDISAGLICNDDAGHKGDHSWNRDFEVTTWPNHLQPTIVQDYREYTAEEILHGILQFSESSGWGDPANLGHWLGAAQRWALKERV